MLLLSPAQSPPGASIPFWGPATQNQTVVQSPVLSGPLFFLTPFPASLSLPTLVQAHISFSGTASLHHVEDTSGIGWSPSGLCLHVRISVMSSLLPYLLCPFWVVLNFFPCFIFLLSTYVRLTYCLVNCLLCCGSLPLPPPIQCKLLEKKKFSILFTAESPGPGNVPGR